MNDKKPHRRHVRGLIDKPKTVEEWLNCDWPIKMYEGNVSVGRTAAGNPKARYEATITFYFYGEGGMAQHRGTSIAASTPKKAMSLLWLETVSKVSKMVENDEWLPFGFLEWYKRHCK